MDIVTYTCPICNKEAEIIDYSTYFDWEHECLYGIVISSRAVYRSKEATRDDWGKYCTMLQNQLDFEYSHGLHDGCDDCKGE